MDSRNVLQAKNLTIMSKPSVKREYGLKSVERKQGWGFALQGPCCIRDSVSHIFAFCFPCEILQRGPYCQLLDRAFCLVPLWTEDMHLAHFPLANGKKTSCLWVSALIIQALSACLNSVVTFPALDLWG